MSREGAQPQRSVRHGRSGGRTPLVAEKHILGHGERRHQAEILVDDRGSRGDRLSGRELSVFDASYLHCPAIRPDSTAETAY